MWQLSAILKSILLVALIGMKREPIVEVFHIVNFSKILTHFFSGVAVFLFGVFSFS